MTRQGHLGRCSWPPRGVSVDCELTAVSGHPGLSSCRRDCVLRLDVVLFSASFPAPARARRTAPSTLARRETVGRRQGPCVLRCWIFRVVIPALPGGLPGRGCSGQSPWYAHGLFSQNTPCWWPPPETLSCDEQIPLMLRHGRPWAQAGWRRGRALGVDPLFNSQHRNISAS